MPSIYSFSMFYVPVHSHSFALSVPCVSSLTESFPYNLVFMERRRKVGLGRVGAHLPGPDWRYGAEGEGRRELNLAMAPWALVKI